MLQVRETNPIAVVIPWFGKDLKGGAEQQAWQIAIRLAERGYHIDVLTTCCRSFQEDWATNHLKAGVSQEHGIMIRRFPVDARDRVNFDRVNADMLSLPSYSLKPGVSPVSEEDSSIFVNENINSSALLNYLRSHKEDYHSFIFIPYLYGTTIKGLPLVEDRGFLQPCLHDEVYAYLPEIEHVFQVARGILFNSEGEAQLAQRLYGPEVARRAVIVGEGVEAHTDHTLNRVNNIGSFQVNSERFILYLGRKDSTKNTDLLVRAFQDFKDRHPDSRLRLVLAGPPGSFSSYNPVDGAIDLGLVKEEEKEALLSNCLALFQPSRNESYSRVIMEAWFHGRPVAAHGECLATAIAVEQSQGGWMARTESEWAELFAMVDCMGESELAKYGEKGRRYAKENAAWDKVIERYEEVLGLPEETKTPPPQPRRSLKEVHQLFPNLAYEQSGVRMRRIAIVISWFGKDLKGGAEQLAWQVATRLAERGHCIEVLTTCCRAFLEDWTVNHLEAGLSHEGQFTIRRFPVGTRDLVVFHRVNVHMLSLPRSSLNPGVSPIPLQDSSIFVKENINSSSLLSYLRDHRKDYDAFVFLPYLYGPVLNGLPIVADRAYLQPCVHDEVYAYLPEVEYIFRIAKGLLFNSEGEARLAERLYGPGVIGRSQVVGSGIERFPDSVANAIDEIGAFQVKNERFILYLGLRDAVKNTDLLVRAFLDYKGKHPDSSLRLVLAGPGIGSYDNPVDSVMDLGLVQEEEKEGLLSNCLALFQPSLSESYSRVIMEAWSHGRPVGVHRDCLATATAVEKAKGGWLAGPDSEWSELFAAIDSMPGDELTRYGANGECYAAEYGTWDKVIERYEMALSLSKESERGLGRRKRRLKEVHQLLPDLAYGDAISSQALAIRDYLRSLGYRSDVFACRLDERVAKQGKVFEPGCIAEEAGLFYHHSIGSEITEYAVRHAGPKCLIYHNITPAEFFEPFRPEFARILAEGRADLNQMAPLFRLSVGDSAYNVSELSESGFNNPTVLPIVVDPNRWNIPADSDLMKQLQDGKANLLFVGRIAPNKKQDQLVEAFAHYLLMDPDARLILVGYAAGDPYCAQLTKIIDRLDLTDHVVLAGSATDSQLLAYYRTAHLFWSMSEHEGFCVPAVEAMWFDIPVLAYKSAAIPETLGGAGAMFTSKDDLLSVAALAKLLARDESLRAKIISRQRERRSHFLPKAVWPKLGLLLDQMETLPRKVERSKRVAFVVQRCGLEVNGGAEVHCLGIARRLSAYWKTEILTTCALDYMTWENHYSPGLEEIEGIKIRRFRVDEPRNVESFNRLSESIHPRIKEASLAEQESWMRAQGPWSTDLIAYIEQHKDEYDAFIFFSYLYATTYFILPKVQEKAYLLPLAHNEWPIRLNMWNSFFERPKGFIFNTVEERDFLKARFPAALLEGPVVGMAVDPPQANGDRFRQRYGIHDPFLLYIGRIDPSKGCEELFHDFIELRKRETHSRKLVLLGKAAMPLPEHKDIIALGFVDEQTKWDALAACDLLVLPSPYESLSLVLLEAWSMGRSVLVNGACDVLVAQCRRSQGGLWYCGFEEFSAAIEQMDNVMRDQLGMQGKRFVQHAYSWPAIESAYLNTVEASQ